MESINIIKSNCTFTGVVAYGALSKWLNHALSALQRRELKLSIQIQLLFPCARPECGMGNSLAPNHILTSLSGCNNPYSHNMDLVCVHWMTEQRVKWDYRQRRHVISVPPSQHEQHSDPFHPHFSLTQQCVPYSLAVLRSKLVPSLLSPPFVFQPSSALHCTQLLPQITWEIPILPTGDQSSYTIPFPSRDYRLVV